ncbi:MAG: hypothetical protein IOD15_00105 [Phycisphaerales bacterium]|nr:hypothetical protein [Phycisphaerales bacterium]
MSTSEPTSGLQMTARPVYDRIEALAPSLSRNATLMERMQWCSRTLGEVLLDHQKQRMRVVNELVGLAVDLGLSEAEVGVIAKASEHTPTGELVAMVRVKVREMAGESGGGA